MNENSKTLPNMSLTAFKALVGQQPYTLSWSSATALAVTKSPRN